MANRYWIGGSGNWSDPSHWSNSSGGAGGASIPSTTDAVIIDNSSASSNFSISWNGSVYCQSFDSRSCNYTIDFIFITGTAFYMDIICSLIYLHNVISTGTYKTSVGTVPPSSVCNVYQSGVTDGNIGLGSSVSLQTNFIGGSIYNQLGSFNSNGNTITAKLIATGSNNGQTFNIVNSVIYLSISLNIRSNVTFVSDNSTIITNPGAALNVYSSQQYNVVISKGNGGLLAIGGTLNVRKLVVQGGASKRSISGTSILINIVGSNQLVAGNNLAITSAPIVGSGKYYAGLGSTNNGGNTGWLFTDAPKVETLVDSFTGTTINTTRWGAYPGAGGSLTQGGGQLSLSGTTASSSALLLSNDQYLLEGSYSTFKLDTAGLGSGGAGRFYIANAQSQYGVTVRRNIPDIYMGFTQTTASFVVAGNSSGSTSYALTPSDVYWRIRESAGSIYFDSSPDGIGYTNKASFLLSAYGVDSTQITARPQFNYMQSGAGSFSIDDFNVPSEPTAEFTSNITSGFTPTTVNFTDQSNFTPTSWSWNFGDSTTSIVQNPTKTYSLPGTYTVSLTSSNSSYTRSVTKVGYITVSPNVYERVISGSLLFGGGISRRLLASRSISGGLVFGGSVRAVLLRDVESIQDKRYLYKVYDETGSYIETWSDVISELSYTHEINTIGSTTEIELARNSDTVGFSTAPLLTESDQTILTEDDFDLLADIESKNQIGSGSSVEYNNRVDIVAFYGSVEPLLTEDDEPINTEDDEDLLADIGAPNGRVIFTGFISEINSRYGNSETTLVQLTSYGWDLGQYPITDNLGNTTVTFNSQDPSNIVKSAVDKFVTDSAPYDTYTYRDANSISNTGTVVSYTFRANTYEDVLGKTLELMPANWYYRVGLGDNLVYYKERSALPQHLFYLGKHIKALDLKGSIINATNRVLFTGGGDPALYIDRSEAPADRTRRSLSLLSDNRVTVLDSAEVITEGQIEEGNKRQYRTTIEILTRQYDIESISVGETVGFRNFGNYVDALVMQIVGLSYSPDSVQLQLETKPPTINKRLADIQRNLTVTENQNIPDSPS